MSCDTAGDDPILDRPGFLDHHSACLLTHKLSIVPLFNFATLKTCCVLLTIGVVGGCASHTEQTLAPVVDLRTISVAYPDIPPSSNIAGSVLAGHAAAAREDFRAAAVYYSFAHMADPREPQLAVKALNALVLSGQMDKTGEIAISILDNYPQNVIASLTSTLLAVREEAYEDALAHVVYLDSFPAARILKPVIEAWASAGLRDLDAVDEHLATLETEPGLTAFAQMHRAMIGHYLDLPTADRDLDLAISASGENIANRLVRFAANRAAAAGDTATAMALLEQGMLQAPTDANLQGHLANVQAGIWTPPISSPAEGIAIAFQEVAGAIAREQSLPISAQLLYWATYLAPSDHRSRQALASVLYDLEWYPDAIIQAQKIPEQAPEYWLGALTAARSLNALDRRDEAIALLKGLDTTRPERTDALNELGFFYRQNEQYDAAAAVYTQAIERVPQIDTQNWTLFYFRGIAYERGKRWSKAEVDLKRALELSDDHPQVLNYLGYSWVEQKTNLDEAFAMIEKAVKQRPRDGYIVDSLGWAHYKLGNYEQAVTYLERAIELMPDDPVVNDHLGDAFWHVGRTREARYQWERALIFDPEEDLRAIIMEKLENGL